MAISLGLKLDLFVLPWPATAQTCIRFNEAVCLEQPWYDQADVVMKTENPMVSLQLITFYKFGGALGVLGTCASPLSVIIFWLTHLIWPRSRRPPHQSKLVRCLFPDSGSSSSEEATGFGCLHEPSVPLVHQ